MFSRKKRPNDHQKLLEEHPDDNTLAVVQSLSERGRVRDTTVEKIDATNFPMSYVNVAFEAEESVGSEVGDHEEVEEGEAEEEEEEEKEVEDKGYGGPLTSWDSPEKKFASPQRLSPQRRVGKQTNHLHIDALIKIWCTIQ